MTNPRIQIDIAANDASGKGIGSALKRLDHLGGRGQKLGKDFAKIGSRGGLGNIARTIGEVEGAASKAFGNSSILGTIGARAGGFIKIGQAAKAGFARARAASQASASAIGEVEAVGARAAASLGTTAAAGESAAAGLASAGAAGEAAAGGMAAAAGETAALGVALGPVGLALGATVAVLGAAAYGGYKLGASWAYTGAELGRLSDRLGVATSDIQKFQAAGERFGTSRGETANGISSFAQTAHDAFYARNPAARVLMKRIGVQFRTKADGTLDYSAMMSDVARGLQAQKDPVTQADIARQLGLSSMLPLLRQGPDAMKTEMDRAGKYAPVASDDDVKNARQFVYDSTAIGQLGERQSLKAKTGAAGMALPVLAGARGAGEKLTDLFEDPKARAAAAQAVGSKVTEVARSIGTVIVPAANAMTLAGRSQERAGARMERAAVMMQVAFGGFASGGRMNPAEVHSRAERGLRLRNKLMARGLSEVDATALAANAAGESNSDFRARQPGGGGRGLWQWDGIRKPQFREKMGVSVENASEDQQIDYMLYELATAKRERLKWIMAHQHGADAGSVADGFTRYVERPANKPRDAADRRNIANEMVSMTHHHHITLDDHRTTVRSRTNGSPRISFSQVGRN